MSPHLISERVPGTPFHSSGLAAWWLCSALVKCTLCVPDGCSAAAGWAFTGSSEQEGTLTSVSLQHLAECLLHSILAELKVEKTRLEHSYVHALCRVYVGVCRQLGDLERARLFCYSLLKEGMCGCSALVLGSELLLYLGSAW